MPCYFSLDENGFGVTEGAMSIKPNDENAPVLAKLHSSFRDSGAPLATVVPYGNGRVGVIGDNLGTHYGAGRQQLHVDLIRKITSALYDPLAEVESADGIAEISCLMLDGKLMIQIVNAEGAHADARTVTTNRIPPLENVTLLIRTPNPPKGVILRPEGKTLPYECMETGIRVRIDRVPIHSILEIDI